MRIFEKDIGRLWAREGFLHCTAMNYLLRVLLIKSGKFGEENIKFGYSFSLVGYFSPHQYLQVRVSGDKWIKIDPWFAVYGIEFGDYAHGRHY